MKPHPSTCHPLTRKPARPVSVSALKNSGFTLVELLVVILIIVVLAAITFSVTQNIRRSATKVADMQNLRSLASAAMAAGSDNAGRLPAIHAGTDKGNSANPAPYWLAGRNTLESYGIYKEACYIPRKGVPGGKDAPPAKDYEWWYRDPSGNDSTPVHYVYFANDTPQGKNPWFMQGTLVKPTKAEYRGATPYETIIQDQTKAFAKGFTDDAWYPVLWSSLISEYPGRPIVAPLVGNNNKPLGVNVMYLDGHAEWVPMNKGKLRYTSSSGAKIYW
jgi:prepilin-type N-terminal cleavage/methylation domain-containing protein/prepilin-type processing-associated H-X9-DG protein